MTAQEAVSNATELHPQAEEDKLYSVLSRVDEHVYLEIMKNREMDSDTLTAVDPEREDGDPLPKTFSPDYGENRTKSLLVPSPYDELYVHRLEAQIYYEQREIKKYANSMALYNQAMKEYKCAYAREHRALPHPPVRYY